MYNLDLLLPFTFLFLLSLSHCIYLVQPPHTFALTCNIKLNLFK